MNNSYIKYVYIILLIIFLCFSFTIHSGKDLNEIAYVIAIGLDVGEANKLKLKKNVSNFSNIDDTLANCFCFGKYCKHRRYA